MEEAWFANPSWWFGASLADDRYISEQFSHLLDDSPSISSPLEQILVYDQLPRHVFRNTSSAHIIEYYLQKALKCAAEIDLEHLDPARFTFALLPFRHTNDSRHVFRAMHLCWSRILIDRGNDDPILRKFLKASYERCPLLGAELATMSKFDRNILENNPKINPILANSCQNQKLSYPCGKRLVMSISGGVDSMICSWLLSDQLESCIHINYNNRPTADAEAAFVTWWCNTHLGVPCFVRKINEIQREPCMAHGLRNTYESYTRNVRYHCYKEFGKDATIVLGHNKDDILENIFTNIAQKSKYDNMDGMKAESRQDGIEFLRPLLHMTKSEIFKFAQHHNIPYLPCSTPVWAQRGQIRSSIVPVLNKWHNGFSDSMHHLSDTLKDFTAFASSTIDAILKNSIYSEKNKVEFTMDAVHDTAFFWRMLFSKVGMHDVSTRSLTNLCSRIKAMTSMTANTIHVVLSKSNKITINKLEHTFRVSIYWTL
jgi:tRNA(Ile)-lysidine synthetase-like protein